MSALNTYTVTIFGQSVNLVSDEPSQKVEALAKQVDALMQQIAEASGVSDCKKVAVLAALKLSCQLLELEKLNSEVGDRHQTLTRLIDTVLL